MIGTARRRLLTAISLFVVLVVVLAAPVRAQPERLPLGLGVAVPHDLGADAPLRFYLAPGLGDALDSLTISEGPHHVEIATAPPWLDPEAVHIDGVDLAFRVVALRHAWAEVVVHARDTRWPPPTMWLRRDRLRLRPWSDVLLGAHHVRVDREAPIHSAAHGSSQRVGTAVPGQALRVREVRDGWIYVEDEGGGEAPPLGWIRWHDGERLHVRIHRRG